MATQFVGVVSIAHVLKTFHCRGALGTRVNPDDIGCVWTGEFDLNTLTCGRGNFLIRKEKVPDSKTSGYVRTGP